MIVFDLQGFSGLLISGTVVTIKLALASLGLGMTFGILGATAKLSDIWIFRKLATLYTATMRGIPELLLVLFLYFGASILLMSFLRLFQSIDILKLSMVVSLLFFAGVAITFQKSRQLFAGLTFFYVLFVLLMIFVKIFGNQDIDISKFWIGVIALSIAFGAYATEVFRMAMQEIPNGQKEAAQAIGMRPLQIFFRITLPQVWQLALPGLGNLFLVLLKDTALVSVIGLKEIMYQSKVAAQTTQQPLTFYMAAAIIYLCLTIVVTGVVMWLEWRADPASRYTKKLSRQNINNIKVTG